MPWPCWCIRIKLASLQGAFTCLFVPDVITPCNCLSSPPPRYADYMREWGWLLAPEKRERAQAEAAAPAAPAQQLPSIPQVGLSWAESLPGTSCCAGAAGCSGRCVGAASEAGRMSSGRHFADEQQGIPIFALHPKAQIAFQPTALHPNWLLLPQ